MTKTYSQGVMAATKHQRSLRSNFSRILEFLNTRQQPLINKLRQIELANRATILDMRYFGLGLRLEFGHRNEEKATIMKHMKMSSSGNSTSEDFSSLAKKETGGILDRLK